jgi:hypothetical protein
MMKRLFIIIFFLHVLSLGIAYSIELPNFGLFAGTSYYIGEINPHRHFYRSWLSFGVLYRYNLNARYAIRANVYTAKLSGSDLDYTKILHPDRQYSPATFQTSLIDVALLAEYNFFPFTPYQDIWSWTPFISAGIASTLILGSDVNAKNTLNIPFGIGAKVNLTSRISAGAEWTFRRTFNDLIDGVENPSGTRSLIHNNDWYSFLGVFITFKFFNFTAKCPAYN